VALSTEAQSIRFTVENSLHALRAGTGGEPRGIGLQNVRRRLALLYPGAHDLDIGEAGGVFRVDLKLDDVSQGGRR
jgi:LytS/YehU family sensor histidine kinase